MSIKYLLYNLKNYYRAKKIKKYLINKLYRLSKVGYDYIQLLKKRSIYLNLLTNNVYAGIA